MSQVLFETATKKAREKEYILLGYRLVTAIITENRAADCIHQCYFQDLKRFKLILERTVYTSFAQKRETE